jgi:hypothetical protein
MGLNLFPALWHCAGFPTLVQSISGKKKWNWRMRFELALRSGFIRGNGHHAPERYRQFGCNLAHHPA